MTSLPSPLRPAALRLAAAVLLAGLCPLAMAQSTLPKLQPDLTSPAQGTEQRFERLVHEDQGSKISETRLGGETRSIQIESKLGGRPYQVVPSDNSRLEPGWNQSRDSSGKARWQVGEF